jgi:hypothetical protein
MTTVHQLLTEHDMAIALTADLEIPVITGAPQAQGDLIVAPARPGLSARPTTKIPAGGIPLLRGNGGHTHLLIGDGTWTPGAPGSFDLGVLDVPAGGTAWLLHEEHGAAGIGAGTYRVGRQQEQWDQVRAVAD